jgi:multimeric flavodoxin WrbA
VNIVILNGNPDRARVGFDSYLEHIVTGLTEDRNQAELVYLRERRIIHCTGCWDCWVKTPGECSFSDDTIEIRKKFIEADMVIFASPLMAGFVSGLLKKYMDKLIPLLHPYITLVRNECHHTKRYDKYPLIGLLIENQKRDKEDEMITKDIFNRFALNFRSDLVFAFNTAKDPNEVINEIDSY